MSSPVTITLNTYADGDANYVSKMNADNQALQAAVNGLLKTLAAAGSTLSQGQFMQALFGTTVAAIIGNGGYAAAQNGKNLTIGTGFAWKPSASSVVQLSNALVLNFSTFAAGTYYVCLDAAGNPVIQTTQQDVLYSVVWSGTAFTSVTLKAEVFMDGADETALLHSTTNNTSYATVLARFEAIETAVKSGGGGGGGLSNPMTAQGDLIMGGAAGAPARLAAGEEGFVLTSGGAGQPLTWQPAPAGGSSAGKSNSDGNIAVVRYAQPGNTLPYTSFDSNVTQGNLILLFVVSKGTGSTLPTVTNMNCTPPTFSGGVWTGTVGAGYLPQLICSGSSGSSGSDISISVWALPSYGGGPLYALFNGGRCYMVEIQGAASDPVEASVTATGNSTTLTIGNVTPTEADCLFSVLCSATTAAATPLTTGYAQVCKNTVPDDGITASFAMAVGSAGVATSIEWDTPTTIEQVGVLMAIKPSVSGFQALPVIPDTATVIPSNFVQAAPAISTLAADSTPQNIISAKATSLTTTFANPIAAGDAIYVAVLVAGNTATPTVTDSLGNTYTLVASEVDTNGTYVFLATGSAAGANTVTITVSASAYFCALAHELSQMVSPASDRTATGSFPSMANKGPFLSSQITTTAKDLIVVAGSAYDVDVSNQAVNNYFLSGASPCIPGFYPPLVPGVGINPAYPQGVLYVNESTVYMHLQLFMTVADAGTYDLGVYTAFDDTPAGNTSSGSTVATALKVNGSVADTFNSGSAAIVSTPVFSIEGAYTIVNVDVTSPAAGNFDWPHGLPQQPKTMTITPTSPGAIWAQNPRFDGTNMHLSASDAGLTAIVTLMY